MGKPSNWVKEVTGRAPMRSPGAPSHPRTKKREFRAKVSTGLLEVVEAEQTIAIRPNLLDASGPMMLTLKDAAGALPTPRSTS